MDGLRDNYHVKGASVAVYHRGQEVYKQHVGVMKDDGQKVDDKTLFRLYSMSKPVTAVAAMQLFEQGKYLLHEEVGKYLPAFWGGKVARLKSSGAYGWYNPPVVGNMTIEQMLTMTAGLTYGGCFHPAEIETSRIVEQLSKDTQDNYTTRQFADAIAKAPLMFEPGSHWNYSFCMDVVGALIEVWSGMSFGEYLKKNIFEPLGMNDTFFHIPEEKRERLSDFWEYNEQADSYRLYGETDRPLYTGRAFESGGAGLISSLEDYGKFAKMLANRGTSPEGVRILGSATVDLMRRDHLNDAQKADYDWETLKGYSYGLGVRTMVNPAAGGSPSSVGEFGWNGLPGPYVLADPDRELAIVYMQQLYPNMEAQIQPRLRNIVYGCIDD